MFLWSNPLLTIGREIADSSKKKNFQTAIEHKFLLEKVRNQNESSAGIFQVCNSSGGELNSMEEIRKFFRSPQFYFCFFLVSKAKSMTTFVGPHKVKLLLVWQIDLCAYIVEQNRNILAAVSASCWLTIKPAELLSDFHFNFTANREA